MRSTAYLGIALGSLLIAAAFADDRAPPTDSLAPLPPSPVTAPAPPAAPKKICRSMDVSGSKIPKRVCATQEEWATFNIHQHEDAQDGLRRLQNQGVVAPASPGVSASQLPP